MSQHPSTGPAAQAATTVKRTSDYEAYIFDLDGTVYLGHALLPTAGETIMALRQKGKRVMFLSNNPTHTRQDYARRLTGLGLPTPEADIITSSIVMVDFLRRTFLGPIPPIFVIGEAPLKHELRAAQMVLSEEAGEIGIVIASFDRTFAYRKLQIAFDAIRTGARFFATNADRYCPVPGGGEPDAAAMIAAVEACTGKTVEAVVGKPSRYMADAVLGALQLAPERCIMIGDRLETDIKMGLDAGMGTALTLTGATSEAMLQAATTRPDFVLRQLADLLTG